MTMRDKCTICPIPPPSRRSSLLSLRGGIGLSALFFCSVAVQFLAAFLSIRFVFRRRLGAPWLLVSGALLIVGGMRIDSLRLYAQAPHPASHGFAVTVIA